ncbi:hypothetical protein CYLTODRAFT_494730 [Cylindrobasidium torrendii FP15055 ss-10]|uniref:Uncharacterized protein n=1 Tax=Cylindrobasidium torrendii FP15055 ss-10 TaxID=1314674 RepID=A0A0D7AV99_9AGAR|nr:hypothetical protein CYLTODRAFT_494730 [Cylindrobasidium torrendii FP15055 ss-10]
MPPIQFDRLIRQSSPLCRTSAQPRPLLPCQGSREQSPTKWPHLSALLCPPGPTRLLKGLITSGKAAALSLRIQSKPSLPHPWKQVESAGGGEIEIVGWTGMGEVAAALNKHLEAAELIVSSPSQAGVGSAYLTLISWPSVQAITDAQNKSGREAVLRSDEEHFLSDMDVAECLTEQLEDTVANLTPAEAEEATNLFDCALFDYQAVEQVQSFDGTSHSQENVVITQDAADRLAADLQRYSRKPIPPVDYTQGLTADEYNNSVIPKSGPFPSQREPLFYAFHLLTLHGFILDVLEAKSRNPRWDRPEPTHKAQTSDVHASSSVSSSPNASQPSSTPLSTLSPSSSSSTPPSTLSPSSSSSPSASQPSSTPSTLSPSSSLSAVASGPSTPSTSSTASSIKRGRTASAEHEQPKPKQKRAKTGAQLIHKKRQTEVHYVKKLKAGGSDNITLEGVKMETIPTAQGGWQGSRALMRSIGARVVAMWHKRTLGQHLRNVKLIPFKNLDQLPTKIFDCHGRLIIYRTRLTKFINPTLTVFACHTQLSPFMAQFIYEAQKFVLVVTYESGNEVRGDHFFQISGHDRNNKQVPMLRAWHREPQNMRALSIFFRKGGPMARITMYVNKTLDQFPGLRARLYQVKEYMEATYNISPMYGLFWNFCLNWGRGSTFVRCLPHVDAMNVAIGVCAIFIMGIFNSDEMCWLCFWDLNIFIQLPPGVVLTYPSALFYHFNYDLSDLRPYLSLDRIEELAELLRDTKITGVRDVDIVVSAVEPTQETRNDCTVLGDSEDDIRYMRSSGVLFTQATMFQTAELKIDTVKMAKEAGMDTECNVSELKEKGMYWA